MFAMMAIAASIRLKIVINVSSSAFKKHTSSISIQSGNIRLYTKSFGNSADPSVLLIAGAGAPGSFWPDIFCEFLAQQGYFVIRFDHRDIGLSTHFLSCNAFNNGPYTMYDLVDDVIGIMDAYDIKQAHLIGHSMGGYLVELISVIKPERIMAGCIISAGPLATNTLNLPAPTAETWSILMSNQPVGNFEQDWPGWLTSWQYLNGLYPFDEAMAKSYTENIYKNPQDIGIAYNHIAAQVVTYQEDFPNVLREIKSPILIIHGEQDPLVPVAHGKALHQLILPSILHLIPKAGHMFFNADLWLTLGKVIAQFLKDYRA